MMLEDQLTTFIYDVRHDEDFVNIGDLGGFAIKMIDTGKCTIFPLVYRLIELALVLPVATTSVERAFSAMNIVKTDLRNKMGDEWMNDSMIIYIEKEPPLSINPGSVPGYGHEVPKSFQNKTMAEGLTQSLRYS
ncbi:uncharacterized protein LOC120276134 [Dioscorea cayenensis subsp. rotundata]|uniref:Uncharacterized protein LOC120276134 n=1 Tax=Dioscorea cayennensis subsp. rotundata TaxID=55577 RepID=A0AB40CKP2_DIOCR|nr:uncharacterized protein LOC120276134 [Dioscorea cayenensis subsp. rotundata]